MANSSRMLPIPMPAGAMALLGFLYLACVALDLINFVWGSADPVRAAYFACSMQSLAIVEPISIPMNLLRIAAEQCLAAPGRSTISIIFLSVKLTLAMATIPLLWGLFLIEPDSYRSSRSLSWKSFDEPGGFAKKFMKFCREMAMMGGFCLSFMLLATLAISNPSVTDLAEKLVIEDLLAIAIPTFALSVSATALVFGSFAFKRLLAQH